MKRNMTITVDEEVARWARIWAARENSSVSHLVGRLLRERMDSELGYARAMEAFLTREPIPFQKAEGYPRRDELYER